jgi:hypothetical protein
MLYQSKMMDDDSYDDGDSHNDEDDYDYDDCGAVGGMIGRRDRSTLREPASVPLCPPQIPHDLTQAVTVGSQRLAT